MGPSRRAARLQTELLLLCRPGAAERHRTIAVTEVFGPADRARHLGHVDSPRERDRVIVEGVRDRLPVDFSIRDTAAGLTDRHRGAARGAHYRFVRVCPIERIEALRKVGVERSVADMAA